MQETPIKVGIVNYLNTKPLLYGLQLLHVQKSIELILDYPAKVAKALQNKSIDIGLVPIAIIPEIPHAKIVGTHCIASNNKVASVCLFSKVPLSEIKNVLLDYQSRTSVQLVKILFNKLWKQEVNYISATENYIDNIEGDTAGVIIGDRALALANNYIYVYDLAAAWKELTQLPFVFAAWVSAHALPDGFIQSFEKANAQGLQHINEIVEAQNYLAYDLHKYYTYNISYVLDAPKHQAIELFLQYISEL